MALHAERHKTFQEGCDLCRWSSVAVAASATPTRKGGAEAARVNATEKRWEQDMPAYRSLRDQGIQPRSIDGAHDLAQRASDKFEIEAGHVLKTKEQRDFARDAIAEMKAAR